MQRERRPSSLDLCCTAWGRGWRKACTEASGWIPGIMHCVCCISTLAGCRPERTRMEREGYCWSSGMGGDAYCQATHPAEGLRYCRSAACGVTPHDDGCIDTVPPPACYSPCGESMTLFDDPSVHCEGYPPIEPATATDGNASTSTGPYGGEDEQGSSLVFGGSASDSTSTLTASAGESDESGPLADPCGNARIENDEVCDDGVNDGRYGGCSPGCGAFGPRCGDETIDDDHGEMCDENGSGRCNAFCLIPGTILVSEDAVIDADTSPVRGIRMTHWHGRVTGVFGGATTSVWELEEDTFETHALRNAAQGVSSLGGALGLEDDGLLVVGGTRQREAHRFDDALQVQWTYTDAEDTHTRLAGGFAGVAATDGGVVLGARDHYNGYYYGAVYGAIGLTPTGELQWDALEVVPSVSYGAGSYNVLDLRGIGPARAVLLGGTPDGAVLRFYDADGPLPMDRALPSGGWGTLCPGDEGSFVLGDPLQGFDHDGEPTFDVVLPEAFNASLAEGYEDARSCVTRSNLAPIVAVVDRPGVSLSSITVFGFDHDKVAWTTTTSPLPCSSLSLALYLDESRARLWVMAGGYLPAATGTRCVYAAIVAI